MNEDKLTCAYCGGEWRYDEQYKSYYHVRAETACELCKLGMLSLSAVSALNTAIRTSIARGGGYCGQTC
jgi:hypothetical protein